MEKEEGDGEEEGRGGKEDARNWKSRMRLIDTDSASDGAERWCTNCDKIRHRRLATLAPSISIAVLYSREIVQRNINCGSQKEKRHALQSR